MDFQRELETLYAKAVELRTQGLAAESELLEAKAAGLLETLRARVRSHPDDPETAPVLLYLAEREWAVLGDQVSVQSMFEQAVSLSRTTYGASLALAKLAEFHYLAGRFGEAEPLYRQAVEKDPSHAKALEGLAQTLAFLGRAAEADPYFVRAIERVKDDDVGKRSLYFLLISRAEGLEKLGRQPEASVLRQKALGLLHKNNPGEFGFQV